MAAAPAGNLVPSSDHNHDQGSHENRHVADNADDYLAKMHALMLAIARQNSIQIPVKALPAQPRTGGDAIEPRGWQYNSTKTINYQLEQRPTEGTCSSLEWKHIFGKFPQARLMVTRKDPPASPSPVKVLAWTLPPRERLDGAHDHYNEFGYDEDGYVRGFRRENLSEPDETPPAGHDRVVSEQMSTLPPKDNSPTGQRFGREWTFGLSGSRDHVLFSIAAAQLCRDADVKSAYNPLGSARQCLAETFLAQFRCKWEPSRSLWGASDNEWTGSVEFDKESWEDLVVQYHMRVFTTSPRKRRWEKRPGPGLKRESGTVTDEKNARTLGIYEIRYSVGLKTTWRLDFPVFSLVTMADAAAGLLRGDLCDRNEWEAAGIRPSVRATGVAAFAFRIRSILPQWEAHWSRLIESIGELLNADLSSILSPLRRREIMVDTADLRLSDFYFTVIQLLRISADWIQESMDDLRQMVDDMERLYLGSAPDDQFATFCPPAPMDRDAAAKLFRENWESVIAEQQRLGSALLARVAKKMDEAKSLRDGLFNATAVNEATKSTQLNHFILVFTVATVFYLPLSFIVALFALGMFSWEDPGQRTSFIITTTVVAGGTYLVSWLSLWVVGNPDRRRNAHARLKYWTAMHWAKRKPKGGSKGGHHGRGDEP